MRSESGGTVAQPWVALSLHAMVLAKMVIGLGLDSGERSGRRLLFRRAPPLQGVGRQFGLPGDPFERRAPARRVRLFFQCASGRDPPSFTVRSMSASGIAAAETSISVQNTST